ncbi:MAG: hypothetical protein ACLQUT_07930 [Thermoleophilia bacterium]
MPVIVKIDVSPAIKNWPQPISDGLESAGVKFKAVISQYPPQNPGSDYVRTKFMSHTTAYKVANGAGDYRLDVGGVKYMTYVLNGTGVYGYTGQPIKPKTGKVLAWKGPGGWHYASSVRGMIWPGKLAEVKAALVSGFMSGFNRAMGRK